ncbi:MAG: hypothetical protein ACREDZ_06760 [Kiloniellales bacterium]
MADHWYDALKRESDEIEVSGRGTVRLLDRAASVDSPAHRAASDPRGREVERLARMNERLLIVMEEVMRLQSSTLERKPDGAPAQRELFIQGGAVDHEAIARVVRDTLDSQMKPVLSALLRLIEVNGGVVAPRAAMPAIAEPAATQPSAPTRAMQATAAPETLERIAIDWNPIEAPTDRENRFSAQCSEQIRRVDGSPSGQFQPGDPFRPGSAPAAASAIGSAPPAITPPAGEAVEAPPAAAAPGAVTIERVGPAAIPLPSFLLAPKPAAPPRGPSPAELRAEAARERARSRLAAKLPLALGWLEVVS